MSWTRIRHILKKELIQIRRDPRALSLLIISPLFQLVVFGYAITSDVKHVPTAILDSDRTQQSRELTDVLAGSSEYFDIRYHLSSPDQIDHLLDSGKAQLALWVPKGFAANLARGQDAPVQAIIDGTDSPTAGRIASYVSTIAASYSRQVAMQALTSSGRAVRLPSVEAATQVWYNPELRSVNFLVPGILAMLLLIVTTVLTSLGVVREREAGTLDQLVVTPIRPVELMLGKVLPCVLIGYANILMVTLVAVLWFKVPIAGSFALLLLLSAAFLVTSLGLGLLVSTISRTQQQAVMISFFIIQPSILLSGFIFPIDNMPRVIQYLTYMIPLRHYLEIIRGIFLRGVGFAVLWSQTLVLCAMGACLITLSTLRFTRRTE